MTQLQKRLPSWQYTNAEWSHRAPDNCGLIDCVEIYSHNHARLMVFYTFRPYGIDHLPNLQQTLSGILEGYNSLVDSVRALNDIIWGSYICWIADNVSKTSIFFCDPLQSVRLYYHNEGGTLSIDPLLDRVLPSQFSWNNEFLAGAAITQFGNLGETPFSEIKLLKPGHALLLNPNGKIEEKRIWPNQPINSNVDAVDHISSALGSVVTRIGEFHESLAVSLSGGVDSTAIALTLRGISGDARPLTGIHLYSPGSPDQDERQYADASAAASGISLSNICMDDYLPFKVLELPVNPNIISPQFMFQSVNNEIGSRLSEKCAILDGQAGDVLFNSTPNVDNVIDAFLDGGFQMAWRAAVNLSSLSNTGLPRIFYSAFRSALGFSSPTTASAILHLREVGLFVPELAELSFKNLTRKNESPHFLKGPAAGEMFTTLEQMITVQPHFGDRAFLPTLSPLLTKPVVEAALSIPSYQHYNAQLDRVILRHAAARFGDSPSLWRRSKGAFDSTLIRGLLANQNAIKELLYDGILSQQGILMRQGIARAFRATATGDLSAAIFLALPVCAEMFCRAWRERAN